MHRTNPRPKSVLRGLLLALLLGVLTSGAARAQDKPAGPAPTLIVPINGTARLQMSKKQIIARGVNFTEAVLRLSPVTNDPTTVLVVGLEPGFGRVKLIDDKGNEESFDIIVQLDVEYLRSVLRRAVPGANVVPIPAGNNGIILTGWVDRADDVDVIQRVAASIVGGDGRVTNAIRVGGVQQVQLCCVVASVNRNELRRLGFSFLENGLQHFVSSSVGGGASLVSTLLPSPAGSNASFAATPNVTFGVTNSSQSFLGVLDALQTEGVTKILSEPRVVTLSGQPANIVSGGETPIITASQSGPTVTYKQFGTVLNFLPIVLGDGRIRLSVSPEESQLNAANGVTINSGFGPTVVPGFNTQSASVVVEMETGQTLAIGGLINHVVNNTASKIPVLGDLPILGAAFRTVSAQETETELVILVTPHLVDPMSHDQLPKYLPGQETRSPDTYELFFEGILEAPRGQRVIRHGRDFEAAYKNGPTATQYPCGEGRGGIGGCASGACGGAAPADVVMPAAPGTHAALPALGNGMGTSPGTASSPAPTPAILPPAVLKGD